MYLVTVISFNGLSQILTYNKSHIYGISFDKYQPFSMYEYVYFQQHSYAYIIY